MTDEIYFPDAGPAQTLQTFNAGTCDPVNKGNCSGNYINPCDCKKYYQCEQNQYVLRPQECAPTLAFNHLIGNCDFDTNVLYKEICNFTAPWRRCRVTADRQQWLQSFCTNISNTLIPTSTTPRAAENIQDTKDENNTGLIVGLVIALTIVVILAVAFSVFWIYRRRKQREREGKSTIPQIENPHYFAETEDTYQQIDDSMHNPTYNAGSTMRPSLPARSGDQTVNGTLHIGNTHGEDFVYDNSAFRDDTLKSETLDCATGNSGNPGSYMTLEKVHDNVQGYDQIGSIGNAAYSSENAMIGEAFVNSRNEVGEEGLTHSTNDGLTSPENAGEHSAASDIAGENTLGRTVVNEKECKL